MYNVYYEIDNLINELKNKGESDFAAILSHRVHKVAWTSSSELFEELDNQLNNFMKKKGIGIDESVAKKLHEIHGFINQESI